MSEASRQPFWRIDRHDEARVVKLLLRRRFGSVIADLNLALDRADPYDLVYPGNPNEYAGVVREFLVILDGRPNSGRETVAECLRLSFARYFDEGDLCRDFDEVVDAVMAALPPDMGGC